VGFGFDLPGQIVAQVFLAAGTAAVGIAASTADGDETGGEDWALGVQFLLASLEGTADQGGVFGRFHAVHKGISFGWLTE